MTKCLILLLIAYSALKKISNKNNNLILIIVGFDGFPCGYADTQSPRSDASSVTDRGKGVNSKLENYLDWS